MSTLAELSNLEALQEHLAACAIRVGVAPRRIGMLTMALEEVFVNICHYAYPVRPGPVTLNCRDEGTHFVAEVIDQGLAFDVRSVAEPDTHAELAARKIGGLGWLLVRKIVDEVDHFRTGGRNVVSLRIRR